MGESPYTLEVTSPGVHRPLTLPRHWRRAATRLVRVTGTDGEVFEGRVVDSDDTSARLEVGGQVREVAYEQVAKAVVQVEFPKEAL
jgi:ribosome maturation factor RimP